MLLQKITLLLTASLAYVQAAAVIPTVLDKSGRTLFHLHSRDVESGTLTYWGDGSAIASLTNVDWDAGWNETATDSSGDSSSSNNNNSSSQATSNTNTNDHTSPNSNNNNTSIEERAPPVCSPFQQIYCSTTNRALSSACSNLVWILQTVPKARVPSGTSSMSFTVVGQTCWIAWTKPAGGFLNEDLLGGAQATYEVCKGENGVSGWAEKVTLGGVCNVKQCMSNKGGC